MARPAPGAAVLAAGAAPGGTRFPTHFVVGTRSPCASGVALGVKIGEVHAATAAFFAAFCRALVPPTTKRVGGLRVGARASSASSMVGLALLVEFIVY